MATHSPASRKPKAIIFDLLTALLDSWSLWNLAAGNSATLGRAWRTHYLELTYTCGAYVPYETLVRDSAARTTGGLPAGAPAELLAQWDSLAPWPEVPTLLARLKEAGHRLAVLTNCSTELGRRAALRCVKDSGVEFDAVVTAEEAGFYKPHPAAYEKVLGVLGVGAEDALFVAGSAADVPGAAAAGMRVVWHNRIGLLGKEGRERVAEKDGGTLGEVLEGVVL